MLSTLPEEKSDIVIIGAGILGCFSARELTAYGAKVTVLEAREDVCTGITRTNTAIVYPGYDNKPGTRKAELCVKANREFGELCEQLQVPFTRCGSLMAAFGPVGERVLQKKLAQGIANGVEGLQLLTKEETLAMEPSLSRDVTAALYAPTTGTVNPFALCFAAYENAAANGAAFHFHTPVTAIRQENGLFFVHTPGKVYGARTVVNCAGMNAGTVREYLKAPLVRVYPTAADYIVLDEHPTGGVKHILFHEPEQGKKGLTLVPTTEGNLLVGPGERDLTDSISATDGDSLGRLEALCAQVVPGLDLRERIRSFAGARPNPGYVACINGEYVRSDKGIHDFSLLEEEGLFSLIGVKTPGLTCARQLALHLAERITAYLGIKEKNESWSPVRQAIPNVRDMDAKSRNALIQTAPAYGNVICRCRDITEGEIIEAIRRGARTMDGIKRRTGAEMGRCQGSRCGEKIHAILSRELGMEPGQVTVDGGGTEFIRGDSHEG